MANYYEPHELAQEGNLLSLELQNGNIISIEKYLESKGIVKLTDSGNIQSVNPNKSHLFAKYSAIHSTWKASNLPKTHGTI